jgi:hypothetical protein
MKKAIMITAIALSLIGCSSMKEVPTRKTYAMPSWYADCAQAGSEGWFWWKEEFVYSCGAGESKYAQAAEEQMYAIAMNNFAKRINSKVFSETKIEFVNDKKSTNTMISYKVSDTAIRQHVRKEMGHFTMEGRHYTFVRLKMPKAVFENLIKTSEAQ